MILLGVALLGPWYYERVYMPPEFPCTFPNAKLEGDPYCGLPIPIFLEIFGYVRWGAGLAALFAREIMFSDWIDVFGVWRPLLILPFFITPVLILGGERSRWRTLSVIAWSLAAAAGGVYLYLAPFRPFSLPWGPLLYLTVALVTLALELSTLTARLNRHPSRTG